MPASRFHIEHRPVCPQNPGFGSAAAIPWDTDVFGFAVAEYKPGDAAVICADEAAFQAAVTRWTCDHCVQLMSCVVPAQNLMIMPVLARLGFAFIELGLSASLPNLQKWTLASSASIRLALPEDHEAVQVMAGAAFRAGRYSADPRFDPTAAARRYSMWIKRALSGENAGDRVFVLGGAGDPTCFFHVNVEGDTANLRLAGVRRDLQGGTLGYRLYAAVLGQLRTEGVRSAFARLSATNTPVLNLYSALGFRFSDPEIVLHWHLRT